MLKPIVGPAEKSITGSASAMTVVAQTKGWSVTVIGSDSGLPFEGTETVAGGAAGGAVVLPAPFKMIDCVKLGFEPDVARLLRPALSVKVSVLVSLAGDEPLYVIVTVQKAPDGIAACVAPSKQLIDPPEKGAPVGIATEVRANEAPVAPMFSIPTVCWEPVVELKPSGLPCVKYATGAATWMGATSVSGTTLTESVTVTGSLIESGTVRVVDPETLPSVAVIVVEPAATAVASPPGEEIVATAVSLDVHVTDAVRSCVLLSL